MFSYIVRRLLVAIPVLFGVTIVNFIIVNMAPGSPLDMLVDPNITEEALRVREEALGLNAPLYIQYIRWLTSLLHGNLGYSMVTFEPVSTMIAERVGPTLQLMGLSLLVGIIIAIPLGIISAARQYSKLDYIATGGSFLGISMPSFFIGLSFIYIFSLKLNLLPSGGNITLGGNGGFWDRVRHLILPVAVLSIGIAGKKVRYVRSSMLEVLGQDYLRTARAKGVREFIVIHKHGLRNALIPIITIVGLEIPALLGGAVVTEQIFSWPGMGQLMVSSILARDYPTLMSLNLLSAGLVLAASLFTDILYKLADPRIKYT